MGGGGGAHYGMNFLLTESGANNWRAFMWGLIIKYIFCLQEDRLITGTFVHDLFIIFNEHFCYFYFLKCYAA